jgi:hypothetical protein
MLLAGLLPLTVLALILGLFYRRTSSLSQSTVLGALTWSFAIALGTEAVSFWNAITFEFFLVCWTAALLALILAALWPLRACRVPRGDRLPAGTRILDTGKGRGIRLSGVPHGAGPQSDGHHGCQRPWKSGQHAFDAVWRIIPAKPHGWSGLALTAFENLSARDQARSKRSAFITLVHAATKSATNFACASAAP